MGEFAIYRGDRIKVGTCEEMYYLRADQRSLISGYSFDAGDRFRFPFPDEDTIEPGQFSDSPHGIWVDSRGDLYVSEVVAENRLQKFARM